ncbi:5-oxoprolinase subunit PxpB [Ferviditalea candida]|uniref:5-oxoprolinase subunit PxpB n=1 Tax=Ferviditalea candida TaxID=3108399 RepID=A0ABU5ZEZ1_9BACL|nr:5-oxoprolinase subunit PxpB [Paenibacillaceae bacterium T2]
MKSGEEYEIYPLGERAATVRFGAVIDPDIHNRVRAMMSVLREKPFPGLVEAAPAFTSVTVYYDPLRVASDAATPYDAVCLHLKETLLQAELHPPKAPRTVEIPVCYDGGFGPDLAQVAEWNGLTKEEVIRIHSEPVYTIYMIGFAPGFPYLGGMSERIAAPRKSSPRMMVPAGSVGIAGKQTGIYPLNSPGGWQIIGRTPLELFRPGHIPPSLLQAGDLVRFCPIRKEEYEHLKERGE